MAAQDIASPDSAKPLRIAHYLEKVRWTVGGVMRAAMDWCSVFASRGHSVTLFTPDPLDVPPAWMSATPGLPHCKVVPALGSFDLLSRSAARVIEEQLRDVDVLHLHAPWTTSNLQVARIGRQFDIPYVLTVHGMLDEWSMQQRYWKKRLYLSLFARRLLDRAAIVHCTATAELQQARRWFANPRIAVLPYLFDLSEFVSLPGSQLAIEAFEPFRRRDPKILFLSRVHEKKGLELLIRAAALLRAKQTPCEIIVAGDGEAGYIDQLKQLARELSVSDSIHFIGLVKGALKLSVFQAADVFVLPTSQENFGLVLPESMACGTPVITTRGVDIWKDIEQGGALIVDRSAAEIASAISSVIANPQRRQKLSAQGRQWVFENLDLPRLTAAYERLYRSCVDRSAGQGDLPGAGQSFGST